MMRWWKKLWQDPDLTIPQNYLEYAGGYVEIMEMREESRKKAGEPIFREGIP